MVKQGMARYVTARDRHIRRRWRAYLEARIRRREGNTKNDMPSVEQLDAKLRVRRPQESRGADLIYSYLKEHRTPTPGKVFEVGEALQACGLGFESGPAALYAAGHDAPLIAFMAQLAQTSDAGARCALDLYAALPLSLEPEIDASLEGISLETELLQYKTANGRPLPVHKAQEYVAASLAAAGSSAIQKAWLKVYRDDDITADPMRGVRSDSARLAFQNARSSLEPYLAREIAWRILDEWTGEFQESWPPLRRESFRAAYADWLRNTTTETNKASKARQAQARSPKRDSL